MTNPAQRSTFLLTHSLRAPIFAFALLCALTLFPLRSAQAQTFTVLYNFTGGQDGAHPWAGITIDGAGNLYGTGSYGGSGNCMGGCGTVFKLSHRTSGWIFSPLYNFNGMPDGEYPEGRLIFGRDGRLYGTTGRGGVENQNRCIGCGIVFTLRPPATFCRTTICPWSEDVLYRFTGLDDGAEPSGDIVFDQQGNLFGTTRYAGYFGGGVVYDLSPSGGDWTLTVPYYFMAVSDGIYPYGGVVFDSSGNLYGTTQSGGSSGNGVVFQLSKQGSGWGETILHNFGGSDGSTPLGGVILDPRGNIYGTTNTGGSNGGGVVFALTASGGGWTFVQPYSFSGPSGPWGDLVMDSSGNVYGTTVQDGAHGFGSVFKLTFSGGSWTYISLHDFNATDGANPHGSIVLDANGNLYGTAANGGSHHQGVVWTITP